ncbi:MAG: DUF4351 domain-containing protein, partial [Thermodesulfobacteriota bacterium]|nr:DUF4351 domain-containing protein [Thermodesulfobacteriota bacterium]
FRLENSRKPEQLMEVLSFLLQWLAVPEQASLRRAFTVWFNRVLFPSGTGKETMPRLEELTEVRTMLAETVVEWKGEWKREGRKEGREEGRKEGEANILLKLLELKFGPLSEEDQSKIQAADSETLLTWGEHILTANSLGEIFRS